MQIMVSIFLLNFFTYPLPMFSNFILLNLLNIDKVFIIVFTLSSWLLLFNCFCYNSSRYLWSKFYKNSSSYTFYYYSSFYVPLKSLSRDLLNSEIFLFIAYFLICLWNSSRFLRLFEKCELSCVWFFIDWNNIVLFLN